MTAVIGAHIKTFGGTQYILTDTFPNKHIAERYATKKRGSPDRCKVRVVHSPSKRSYPYLVYVNCSGKRRLV